MGLRDGPVTNESDEAIKECFEVFDKDKDGFVTASEIPTIVRALGKIPYEDEVAKMVEEAGGANKKVNLATVSSFVKRKIKKPQDMERDMRAAFNALDKDGNGQILEAELRQILTSLGAAPLTPQEVDMLLRDVDVAENGTILYDEFVDLLVS